MRASSEVFVIRGRVVTGRRSGLPGVRISHETDLSVGFTLSRMDGTFDLLLRYRGDKVKLSFGKSPFLFHVQEFPVKKKQVSGVKLEVGKKGTVRH